MCLLSLLGRYLNPPTGEVHLRLHPRIESASSRNLRQLLRTITITIPFNYKEPNVLWTSTPEFSPTSMC
jgi:hypothetical protein